MQENVRQLFYAGLFAVCLGVYECVCIISNTQKSGRMQTVAPTMDYLSVYSDSTTLRAHKRVLCSCARDVNTACI